MRIRKEFVGARSNLSWFGALAFDALKIKWTLPIVAVSRSFWSATGENGILPDGRTMAAVTIARGMIGGEKIRGENAEVFKVPHQACRRRSMSRLRRDLL